MPSARRHQRNPRARQAQLAALCLCGVLAAGTLAGCETTQEKAAAQQAESARILKARERRQHHGPKSRNPNADGTKSPTKDDKSARRPGEVDKAARGEEKSND